MLRWTVMAAAMLPVALSGSRAWAGDAGAGKTVFNQCVACHALDRGKHKIGPSLHQVIGRAAGSQPGFNYSEAMRKAGVVWDDAALRRYVADPARFMPGNKMAFPGIKDAKRVDDLIEFLRKNEASSP